MMNILAELACADTDAIIAVVESAIAIPNVRNSKPSKSASANRSTVVEKATSSAAKVIVPSASV